MIAVGWLIIAIAVTDDAARRGNSALWGIATILFGIFAALLYLLYRNDETVPMYRCEGCKSIYFKDKRIERHERNTGHNVELET